MVTSINSKHEKIFDYLLELHEKDSTFLFVPRKINNQNRLNDGYWFIGNERYLQVSFWDGGDWKEKIHNIAFSVKADGASYMEFSAQDSEKKAGFFRELVDKFGGFRPAGKKNKWYRDYSGTDYMSNLKYFLKNEKPVIDEMVRKHEPYKISFIDEKSYQRYINKVESFRRKQKVFGDTHKVARVCWNAEGWKFPSGLEGKSLSKDSFERQNGYGHEEWLFDRSRVIDGYHYAFLQPLNVKSGKHVGKTYDISLFTINADWKKFYVGDIKNAKCISKDEAKNIYQVYKDNGWINGMVTEIKEAGANPKVFLDNLPKFIFNVKFKFEDIYELDGIEEISGDDMNISTTRFKLLPKKSNFITENISVEEDDAEDKQKDESTIKVVYNKEIERVQYHNRIQNALVLFLKESYQDTYIKVLSESARVDIKAKMHNGKWHYFEIKTATPKKCIREALGQIMEYAYWSESERAEKLIIVGDSDPDKDAKTYLQHIRNKFAIPVYYRCFNLEKNAFSEYF